jgi:hypothetical protein
MRIAILIPGAGISSGLFGIGGDSVMGGDPGVDQGEQLVPLFGSIDYDNLLVNIDLERRKANSASFVHSFRHVRHKFPNILVDVVNGNGWLE